MTWDMVTPASRPLPAVGMTPPVNVLCSGSTPSTIRYLASALKFALPEYAFLKFASLQEDQPRTAGNGRAASLPVPNITFSISLEPITRVRAPALGAMSIGFDFGNGPAQFCCVAVWFSPTSIEVWLSLVFETLSSIVLYVPERGSRMRTVTPWLEPVAPGRSCVLDRLPSRNPARLALSIFVILVSANPAAPAPNAVPSVWLMCTTIGAAPMR